MNPCPCGNYGEPKASCVCSPINVIRYRKNIRSLLDRIDIQINVPRETATTTQEPIPIKNLMKLKKQSLKLELFS